MMILEIKKEEKILTLVQEELKIISVNELMKIELKVPEYQRPYRWSSSSTNTLFADTFEAFKSRIDEYRLGSVILHMTMNSITQKFEYNLVDGQQRTTTLSILLYVLGEKSQKLLSENYKPSSRDAIYNNYKLLQKRVNELSEEEKSKYKDYLEKNCTVVKIVTDSEQEAFQFFDSQNSRGKSLKPHDLLKSYHLREMARDPEELKISLISEWEDTVKMHLRIYLAIICIQSFVGLKTGMGYIIHRIKSNILRESSNLIPLTIQFIIRQVIFSLNNSIRVVQANCSVPAN